MLAEGDPLAVELFERHDQISMPNMNLNEQDVAALIEYMTVESRRMQSRIQLAKTARSGSEPGAGAATACCQKNKSAVLRKSGLPASADGDRNGVEERRRRDGVPGLAALSAGLGCLFLVLAGFFKQGSGRRWQSANGRADHGQRTDGEANQ